MQKTIKRVGKLVQMHVNKDAAISTEAGSRRPINRDLSTWRAQIEKAIKEGGEPGKSVWGNTPTTLFDENEWEW